MRIIVMSDTHGNYPLALRACSQAGSFDAVIHLGDGSEDVEVLSHCIGEEVIHVAGNCDHGSRSHRELVWECQGKRLLLVHGDAFRVKNGLQHLEQRAAQLNVDAVLFGHTHLPYIDSRNDILFINPGTLMKGSASPSFATLFVTATELAASLETIDPLP